MHGPVRYHSSVKGKYVGIASAASLIKPGYAAMIEALDDSVGTLLDGLEELGISDNTLVVFYSDNGGLLSNTTNAPYRNVTTIWRSLP